ncbi:MAG TPA: response regulator [Candidatus Saccharimonadales bacterium]|nr:response regulator [Candidatus Saccharimonadales bacterium]
MSKLLLVEDDNNLREIYEARLQAEGYSIVTAKDGEDALAVAKAEKPDLIISDVMMPKISGFEMLDILKNTDGLKNVKVIMLTALGQSDDQQRADKLGADRYLVKSQVTLEDIVRVAHELLEDGGDNSSTTTQDSPTPTPDPVPPAPAPVAPTLPATPTVTAPAPVAVPTAPAQTTVTATPPATTVATPDPVPPAPASNAQSSANEAVTTSEESATIESQIEDFVAGATSDAPAPSPEPPANLATAPATPTTPLSSPSPAPSTAPVDSSSSTDDKLINETVNSLMTDSASPSTTTQETPASPAPVAPTIQTSSSAMVNPAKTETNPSSNTTGSTMSHEKVINPPANSEVVSKPDIQALFAAEQAKEAKVGAVVQPQPATQSADKPIDPNSIAL